MKLLGGISQKGFNTTLGLRWVDQLINGIAHESKVGYTSLRTSVAKQVAKDVELIQTGQVNGVVWHFFRSPVTGLVGPSQPLLDLLEKSEIGVIIHP